MRRVAIETIREGLLAGKPYLRIADELGVSDRTLRRRYPRSAWTAEEIDAQRRGDFERRRATFLAARPAPVTEGLWVAMASGWRVTLLDAEDRETFAEAPLFGMAQQGYVGFWDFDQRGSEYLHRRLLGLRPGERSVDGKRLQVDHRNRDPLDNRRRNIWICTPKQNCANRGGRFAVAVAT